jgi:hypothetical protein
MLTLLVALGLVVAGCGSQKKAGAIAASQTATGRVVPIYSVSQVKSAFADRGIELRRARRQARPGVTVLLGRPGARALVNLGLGNFRSAGRRKTDQQRQRDSVPGHRFRTNCQGSSARPSLVPCRA